MDNLEKFKILQFALLFFTAYDDLIFQTIYEESPIFKMKFQHIVTLDFFIIVLSMQRRVFQKYLIDERRANCRLKGTHTNLP